MADCSSLFEAFNDNIKLTESRKISLRTSRDSLRDKIELTAKEKEHRIPSFKGQGSFTNNSIVNPIPRKVYKNGEFQNELWYDIDDGVYFSGDQSERELISTYHQWVKEAVENHTVEAVNEKDVCIRVVFADGHHIDLPIYHKCEEGLFLASKSKGWIESDPTAFLEWFKDKTRDKDQLKRLIRYIKAWSDYQEKSNNERKLPTGLILTILTINQYYKHDRDDISFKETIVNIIGQLDLSFQCYRPTIPDDEDLLATYSDQQYFMDKLKGLRDCGERALKEENQKESCNIWQEELGDRFPCHLAKDEKSKVKESASFIATASKSSPWSE